MDENKTSTAAIVGVVAGIVPFVAFATLIAVVKAGNVSPPTWMHYAVGFGIPVFALTAVISSAAAGVSILVSKGSRRGGRLAAIALVLGLVGLSLILVFPWAGYD